jgi:hypothetical protein
MSAPTRLAFGVAPERTFKRDLAMSLRHRMYGIDCLMTDLDFWVIEYTTRRLAAVIDYKHEAATWPPPVDINARALGSLETGGRSIPLVFVRYGREPWWFTVRAGNPAAALLLGGDGDYLMTELEYVRWLHRIRGVSLPQGVGNDLDDVLPVWMSA